MSGVFDKKALEELIQKAIEKAISGKFNPTIIELKDDFKNAIQIFKEFKDKYQFEYNGFSGYYQVLAWEKIDEKADQINIFVEYGEEILEISVVKDEKAFIPMRPVSF